MNEEDLKQAITSIRTKIAFLKAMVEIANRSPSKHQHVNVEKIKAEIARLEKAVNKK